MSRKHHVNIPVEILRTVATVADLGSFRKAGNQLGVSQSAISAQIKRLQLLIGGPIFHRVAGGVSLDERGKLMMPFVRRLLEANDRILLIGGATQDAAPMRLGLSNFFADAVMRQYKRQVHGEVAVICDNSSELLKGLSDGYIDLACVFNPNADAAAVLVRWREEFVWARGESFLLSPGAPVPLVGWPGFISDQIAIQALEMRGLSYRIVFSNSDYHSRVAAVAAGLGVMALPMHKLAAPLIMAKEYYLPDLPLVEAGICMKHGLKTNGFQPVIDLLRNSVGDRSIL